MENIAKKENINKLSYCDLPIEALESMAKVFQDSKISGKYARDNHFKPMKNTDLIDAIFRHTIELIKGNDIDESGNSHYAHIISNASMCEYHLKKGTLIENRCKKLQNEQNESILESNKS